jgi:DNA-binding IscR family transcriptional regulator
MPMTPDERQQLLQIVLAHEKTLAVCKACAERHATSLRKSSVAACHQETIWARTIAAAEDALNELTRVRDEVERLKHAFSR